MTHQTSCLDGTGEYNHLFGLAVMLELCTLLSVDGTYSFWTRENIATSTKILS